MALRSSNKLGILKKFVKNRKVFFKVLALILIVTISVAVYILTSNEETDSKKNNSIVVTESTERPDENPPDGCTSIGNMPREISFPTLDKNGCIQMVGVDRNGDIAVPTNIHIAGWYINSVKPGEKGLSIMDGHRDGVTKPGLFKDIDLLKKSDRFTITLGDMSEIEFEVVDVKVATIKETYDLMYEKKDDIESQLNLVSCIGNFDKKRNTYDSRVLVVSKRVE